MPPNRRNRAFSPYTYNIQYAKPGEGPIGVQQPRPYVNMAILPEEHLVIAKKDPNWFVYVTNEFNYSLDQDCNLSFTKMTSTLKIVNKADSLPENGLAPLAEVVQANPYTSVDASKPSSTNHTWTSSHTLQIFGNTWDYIDLVVIADGKYMRCKKKNTGNIIVEFGEEFDFNAFRNILVIYYPVAGAASTYEAEELGPNDCDYSEIMKAVFFENKFASTKCVPLIFDEDGFTYIVSDVNLMPNMIAVAGEEVGEYDLQSLQNERSEIMSEINRIANSYPAGTTEAYIEMQNSSYAACKERLNEIDAKIRSLNGGMVESHISKIVEYSFQFGEDIVLQHGKNTDRVTWNGNVVVVKHDLNGYVNFVLDGSTDYANRPAFSKTKPRYEVSVIDRNTLKIEFSTPVYPVCTLRVFKFGAAK